MGLADGMADTANVLRTAAANAASLEESNRQLGQEAGALDVYSHTFDGLSDRMQTLPGDLAQAAREGKTPGQISGEYYAGLGRSTVEGLMRGENAHGFDAAVGSFEGQVNGILSQGQQLLGLGDQPGPEGALQTVGAVFGLLTSIEQLISTPLAMIPFPAFPAVRITDMDIGLPHAHSHPPNLIPPAPPVPLPSTGPVIPIPFLSGAIRTLINGLPAARCGDMGLGIWCGGYFPMYEIFLGSSNVWIEGARAARLGVDITRHCIFTTPRPQDPPIGPMIGFTITGSHNVLIGGVPMPSLLGFAMGAALKGLFRGAARVARRLQATQAAQRLSTRLHRAADRILPRATRLRNRVHRAICAATGHPVDIATGKVFTEAVDVELAGRLPLRFERVWYSTSSYSGPLGHGWHHNLDLELREEARVIALRLEDGRYKFFPRLPEGGEAFDAQEEIRLSLTEGEYRLDDAQRRRIRFGESTSGSRTFSPVLIEDRNSNWIRFDYNDRGVLTRVHDSSGRSLVFELDESDRISAMIGPDPSGKAESIVLRRYRYSPSGDLVQVFDAVGNSARYAYTNHLLVRETDRNGFSFHFEYDGADDDARCVKTWGDGGLYSRTLEYDLDGKNTKVRDASGNVRVFFWNDAGLPTTVVDPHGNETVMEWDEDSRLIVRKGAAGHEVRFQYDEKGRLSSVVNEAGSRYGVQHDSEGNPVSLDFPNGTSIRQEFDIRGNLTATTDVNGSCRRFRYDSRGRLLAVDHSDGNSDTLTHSEDARSINWIDASGGRHFLEFTSHGRLCSRVDPQDRKTRYEFDVLGRLSAVHFADGSSRRWEYDAEGNLLRSVDPAGRSTEYRYRGFNKPLERIDRRGNRLFFEYDLDERLMALVNSRGERYEFIRDASGRIIQEIRFDGVLRTYEYDPTGFVRSLEETSGEGLEGGTRASRKTEFVRDPTGLLLKRVDSGGDITEYSYDSVGQLVFAKTSEHSLAREYDGAGNLLEEVQDGQSVRYEYDLMGRLEKRISPSGREVRFDYDPTGRLVEARIRQQTGEDLRIGFERNSAGEIVRQTVPGSVTTLFRYDSCGRLIEHVRSTEGHLTGRRAYSYDGAGNLSSIYSGESLLFRYRYDPVGQLSETLEPEKKLFHLEYDQTGNLLQKGKSRWEYSEGDRIASRDGEPYKYDAFGNLVERPVRTRDGWRRQFLEYDGRNQLVAVRDSERTTLVRFTYDALGRRVRKITEESETRYLWDGSRLLSEDDGNRTVEYLFDDFKPLAQMEGDQAFFFHCDHLGTPIATTDKAGRTVWEAACETFGRLTNSENGYFQPIRFPGQYEDIETGLHYNLLRYYDPEDGRFVQQDPVGLHGGVNLYQYAPNPVAWKDPFGLSRLCADLPTGSRVRRDNSPHYVIYETPDGALRVRFKADEAVTLQAANPGRNYTADTYAALNQDGKVFVHEGRHRAIGAAKGDQIPPDVGGVPNRPGYLDYEFTPDVAREKGVPVRDLDIDYTQPDVPTVSESESIWNQRFGGS